MNFSKDNASIEETNRIVMKALLIQAVLGAVIWILQKLIYTEPVVFIVIRRIYTPFYIIILATFLILHRTGYGRPVVCPILFTELILYLSVSYLLFGNLVIIFITVPVVASTRLLNRKLTSIIGILTWFSFVMMILLDLYLHKHSELFFNLHAIQENTIWDYPMDVFLYYFIPTTFAFFILIISSQEIAHSGRIMLKKVVEQTSRIAVIDYELSMASRLQQSVLPEGQFTSADGKVVIKASEKPAREVGGDFYNYFSIDERHTVFMIADVADKGLSAAMFMMAAFKTLRIESEKDRSLEDTINEVNRLLCENNSDNLFVTLWIGVADALDRKVKFVNCGHYEPILAKCDGTVCSVINEPDPILGCFNKAHFHEHEFAYGSGDKLIIYTDGITDIMNNKNESFNIEGLTKTIKQGITNPDSIISCCETFAGEAPQFDDMTIMEVTFL